MAIGSFGSKITFETSDKRILTFKNFKREVSGRWAIHPRIGKKPLRQFLGADCDIVTLTVTLSATHGVNPRSTLNKIEKLVRKGMPNYLVVGSKKVGSNKFVVTKISETWDEIYNRGELVRATMDLTFQEYPS